jgi:hypothetical protein
MGLAALCGHMMSACDALTLSTHTPCSYIDPATLEFKRPKMLPVLGEKELRPRKEPFALAVIDALRDYLHGQSEQCTIQHVFLTAVYAAYDWLCLGTFSGSCVSECAQTSDKKDPTTGKRHACVPNSPAAGPWANQPITFIDTNFVFYGKDVILVANKFRLLNAALDHTWELHLCFCFDKSKNNFTVHKHTCLPGVNFDPVVAAINIV